MQPAQSGRLSKNATFDPWQLQRWLIHENWVEFDAVQESIMKHIKIGPLETNGHKPVQYIQWAGTGSFMLCGILQ